MGMQESIDKEASAEKWKQVLCPYILFQIVWYAVPITQYLETGRQHVAESTYMDIFHDLISFQSEIMGSYNCRFYALGIQGVSLLENEIA